MLDNVIHTLEIDTLDYEWAKDGDRDYMKRLGLDHAHFTRDDGPLFQCGYPRLADCPWRPR